MIFLWRIKLWCLAASAFKRRAHRRTDLEDRQIQQDHVSEKFFCCLLEGTLIPLLYITYTYIYIYICIHLQRDSIYTPMQSPYELPGFPIRGALLRVPRPVQHQAAASTAAASAAQGTPGCRDFNSNSDNSSISITNICTISVVSSINNIHNI